MKIDMTELAKKSKAFDEAKEVAQLTAMLLSGIVTGEYASEDLERTVERAIEDLSPAAQRYYDYMEAEILRSHIGR